MDKPPPVDYTGHTFGSWTVLSYAGKRKVGKNNLNRMFWLCRCKCGYKREHQNRTIREESSRQCEECANKNKMKKFRKYFGHDVLLHQIWQRMRRVNKGEISPEWDPKFSEDAFGNFKRCVKRRPSDYHRLCRPDPSLPWGPGNVRWKKFKMYRWKGIDYTLSELADVTGINMRTLESRLERISVEDACSCRVV